VEHILRSMMSSLTDGVYLWVLACDTDALNSECDQSGLKRDANKFASLTQGGELGS
jgi:hypothetical protein